MRALVAIAFAALASCGSRTEQPPVPQPTGPPVAWGGPPIDCSKLWSVEEITAACQERVTAIDNPMEGVPFDSGVAGVGRTIRVCARQVTFEKRAFTDTLTLDVIAWESPELARSNVHGALGAIETSGKMRSVRTVKGRLHILLTTLSATPLCAEGLANLQHTIDSRIP